MIEDNNIAEQVAADAQDTPVNSHITDSVDVEVKVTDADRNFRALREKADKAERERDELLKFIKENQATKTAAPVKQEEPDFSLGADDLVEGKHLNKVGNKIKNLEAQLKSYEQQNSQIAIENKLRSQYIDFDSIVSQANVEKLRELHPEIAQTLASSNDLYSAGATAYKIIKQLGVGGAPSYQRDRDLAHQNAAKPRPVASVSPQQGDSPLSHANAFANGLTEELKQQLRKEMADAQRNHN